MNMTPPAHITITREMAEFIWNSLASGAVPPDAAPAEFRKLKCFRQAGGRRLKDNELAFIRYLTLQVMSARMSQPHDVVLICGPDRQIFVGCALEAPPLLAGVLGSHVFGGST